MEAESLSRLQGLFAGVAAGQAPVVQAGECAEDPQECTAGDVERKAGLLNVLVGVEIPVYRGHIVNGPEPDPEARRPDPWRLLADYRAASQAIADLGPTPRAPPLVEAVRAAGPSVIWLVDPMHANTVTIAEGRKTRVVDTLVREVPAYTLCDPRLNPRQDPRQAVSVVSAWRRQMTDQPEGSLCQA